MIAHVLVEYVMPDSKNEGSVAILGVFDDQELAERHRKELENDTDDSLIFYEVVEYEMNTIQRPEEEDISDDLEALMKQEIIDYTIGEDGEFYFHLTEKGKKIARDKRNDED